MAAYSPEMIGPGGQRITMSLLSFSLLYWHGKSNAPQLGYQATNLFLK
jgi:hypothetical protein